MPRKGASSATASVARRARRPDGREEFVELLRRLAPPKEFVVDVPRDDLLEPSSNATGGIDEFPGGVPFELRQPALERPTRPVDGAQPLVALGEGQEWRCRRCRGAGRIRGFEPRRDRQHALEAAGLV